MTNADKKKIIATNAPLSTAASFVSLILPMVAESMTEDRGGFPKAMTHVFPLFAAIGVSTTIISRAIGDPTA